MLTKQIKTNWEFDLPIDLDDSDLVDKHTKRIISATGDLVQKWEKREDWLKYPEILLELLEEIEKYQDEFDGGGKLFFYISLMGDLDQSNTKIKSIENRLRDVIIKVANDTEFITNRLSKIPQEKQQEFLTFPGLQKYRHHLEEIFKFSKFILSEPEEKLINLFSTTSYSNWVKMTSEFLSKEQARIINNQGKTQKVPFSALSKYMESRNKKVRDSAAKAFNKIVTKHIDTAVEELNSVLNYKKTYDEIKKADRPDLFRHLDDDVNSEIVDALIKAVEDSNEISRGFYNLKAQMLGVSKLEYHERNVELGELVREYSFEDSVKYVSKVFIDLDPQFNNIFQDLLKNGRVDVYPKKGKASGAYCTTSGKNLPIYVLLNHANKLNDVTTIAHEMGHAINFELMKKQNSLDYDVSTFVTEVASTFMEDFVLDEIATQLNDKEKMYLNMMRLNDAVSTIHRQVACYKFETALHKEYRARGYLSQKEIGEIFNKYMAEYMGDYVEMSPGSENWWVYWSHIRSFFYVYSYAGGLLISKSLQDMVKKDHTQISKVKEFLSLGTSKSPKESFLDLGINITDPQFWKIGLGEIKKLLTDTQRIWEKYR